MYRVIVTPAAIADVDYLEDWLLKRGADYGLALGGKLADASATLVEYSERTSLSKDGRYRELHVTFHSNQYVIQYQVHGDAVVILRIRHSLERR
ncbi:addiction module toxin RelE [Caulobacter radicis]|uniref:type II toxin-antitoxin system RelE/ParE family toxin n=1 Tax=Caulobacter radicis TaxID=2172650 RepID=UPI000D575976|nr:type II toxin-antitoxin system RelE/ParE family toxin [Caulobacter radicis]PVM93410.1 addiction module toxin RelE [Caulobacter radicis]